MKFLEFFYGRAELPGRQLKCEFERNEYSCINDRIFGNQAVMAEPGKVVALLKEKDPRKEESFMQK